MEISDSSEYFNGVIEFLSQYNWIYNIQNTKLIVKKAISKIPILWKEALMHLSTEELNQVPFGYIKDCWPSDLKMFLSDALILGSFRQNKMLYQSLNQMELIIPTSIRRGMSQKKILEVKNLAQLIANICLETGCTSVLDIGSGLGYLAQVLHNSFGLYVVGIDCNEKTCHGAKIRATKSSCKKNIVYNVLRLESYDENEIKIKELFEKLPPPELCDCIQENKVPDTKKWLLVALHACGNLTPEIMKLFIKNIEFEGMIVVSCCYHKLYDKNYGFANFPMSQKLNEAIENQSKIDRWTPCPFGMRLASQETRSSWAQQTQDDHDKHIKHVAYRGVLEAFFDERVLKWEKLSRRIPLNSYESFETYINAALNSVFLKEHKQKLLEIFDFYKADFPLLEMYTLFQLMLQPVWESLICLDRIHYLNENSMKVDVKCIADDSISPRNLAIVSTK